MSVQYVKTADEFKKLLEANKRVVTDFTATWCQPCKTIAPMYEALAKQNSVEGELAFAKIDVDDVPEVAATYSVTAMPTFLFFESGKPVPVDTKGAAAGGGVVLDAQGLLSRIRGADLKNLTVAANELGKIVKGANPAATAEKVEEPTA